MTRQKQFTEEERETQQQSRDRLGEFFQQSHRLSLLNVFTLYKFIACPWKEMAINFTYIIMKRTPTLLEFLFYSEFNTTLKDDVTRDSKKSLMELVRSLRLEKSVLLWHMPGLVHRLHCRCSMLGPVYE